MSIKNNKKIVSTILLIIIVLTNISQVFAINAGDTITITNLGDCNEEHLYYTRDGVRMKITTKYLAYYENGKYYPAYCVNKELPGAEIGDYDVSVEEFTKLSKSEAIWRVLVNGYPYKTAAQLGVENDYQAYICTKQAIYRIIDGENASLFVKNLENVQGDERDIIIFSVGYAKNDYDKVVAQFGPLSNEGGENRLNVAITRAKKKIYVVTSIEPEELDRAETTKNNGPKLLKKYLQYVRAVSENKPQEIKDILSTMHKSSTNIDPIGAYEIQIKEALENLGYEVDINLGNTDYKLSLGVFDRELNTYVLGVECDYRAFHSSTSILERDVYRFKFLESRGWVIVRVWSRDWWLSREKVLADLVANIERQKSILREKINNN